MTRRVVIAIIINVWLVLLTAGCSTYFITRSLLLADLDENIVSRVASLPGIERPESLPHSSPEAQDRFVIRDKAGRVVSSLGNDPENGGPAPRIISRGFTSLADGSRLRTLSLQAFARPENPANPPEPVTVIYSASSDRVDALLRNLLYSFSFFGILAAVASALVAQSAAKAALRPMRDTADMIGKIDERSLNRRIEVKKLPPELAPVGVKLNDMLGRLETAFAQRRQFLANASHELRTPVAALVTALEVALRRRRENDDYIRILDQSLADAQLLNHLVVTLVDQARLDRMGDEPEFGPVVVSLLLRRAAGTLAAQAQKKGLRIECNFRDDATVFTDEGMLRSAILNLLSNAVEYTPLLGLIRISTNMSQLDQSLPEVIRKAVPDGMTSIPRLLVITIQDNGPGIKPELLENVFEPFFRAEPSRTDSKHHLGLGLASVRLIVRAMGGECRVESPPREGGTGCVFRIELPTAIANPDKRQLNPLTEPQRVGQSGAASP